MATASRWCSVYALGLLVAAGCGRTEPLEPRDGASSGSEGTNGTNGSSSSGGIQGVQCPNYIEPDVRFGGTCPTNLPLLCSGTIDHPIACDENACPPGFTCNAGNCQLNGSLSPVEVTLSWDTPEDFDLHVVEPLDGETDGEGCELFWDNVGPNEDCPSQGHLDRDSNPGCELDNINIENVLYPVGVSPPRGVYVVRVDFYEDCVGDADLGGIVANYQVMTYAVQVRANGLEFTACGSFTPQDADYGYLGSGLTMAAFQVPPPLTATGECDCAALPCATFQNPLDTTESVPLNCDARACACLP